MAVTMGSKETLESYKNVLKILETPYLVRG